MTPIEIGSSGAAAFRVQYALAAKAFYTGALDGSFGPGTKAAVVAFQNANGLTADGVVGPTTATALGIQDSAPASCGIDCISAETISEMFPGTPIGNIEANLPYVLNALADLGIADQQMILMALGTIRAEAASFLPISEGVSQFNTSPGGRPFDLYDHRSDLGNQGPPDGSNFRGRGFVQLTGRSNFQVHSQAIGLGDKLITDPTMAHDPTIAAKLLASFLKSRESQIRAALAANNLAEARRLVNGGSNGLPEFSDAYTKGLSLIPKVITTNINANGTTT